MPDGWSKLYHNLIDTKVVANVGIAAWAVYTVLVRHADEEGHCFPSIRLVVERTGMSSKTVQRSIQCLCKGRRKSVARGGRKTERSVLTLSSRGGVV